MLGSAEVVTFIATLDPEKAREFYEETLGLHFVKDDSFAMVFEMGKEPGVEGGGVPLRVVKVGTLLPHPFTVLGWNVADIMKTVTALAERGIAISVGAREFIKKPFSLDEFAIRLHKMINDSEALKRLKSEKGATDDMQDLMNELEEVLKHPK